MLPMAADGFDGDSILRPKTPARIFARDAGLWLVQHPIIADDRNITGLRRLDATLTNSALERLEGGHCRQRAAGIGFALDEMDERTVFQPQRHVADAFRLRRLQFRKYTGNQLSVLVRHF